MSETTIEGKTSSKEDQWRERLAEQERSGLSVKQFCQEHEFTQYSFYAWRRRLRKKEVVRFALVDRGAAQQEPAVEARLELVLTNGERLRISSGVDAPTLRKVLEAVRA
jgi:hypothetical protein